MTHQIRQIFLPCILLVISLGLSCSYSTSSSDQNIKEIDISSDEVILEIWSDASDLIYPSGRVLELRLLSNGDFEFDKYPLEKDPNNNNAATLERKRSKLSSDELETVITLLRDQRLYDSHDLYKATTKMRDIEITKTIKITFEGKTKQIILKENDSHLNLKEKDGIYPSPLLELLKFSSNIRTIERHD